MVDKDIDFAAQLDALDEQDTPAEQPLSGFGFAKETPAAPMDFGLPESTKRLIDTSVGERESEQQRQSAIDKAREILDKHKERFSAEREKTLGPQAQAIPPEDDAWFGELFRGTGRAAVQTQDMLGSTMRQGATSLRLRGGVENEALASGLEKRGQQFSDDSGRLVRQIPAARVDSIQKIRLNSISEFARDMNDYMQYGVGQVLGFYAPVAGGYLVGGLPGLGVASTVLGVGEVRQVLEEEGVTDPKLLEQYGWAGGMTVAALDALVPAQVLTQEMRRGLGKYALTRIAKTAAQIGMKEALTETMQEMVQITAAAEAAGIQIGEDRASEEIYNMGKALYQKRWQLADAAALGFVGGKVLGTPGAVQAEIAGRREDRLAGIAGSAKPLAESGATIEPDTRTIAPSQEGPTPRLRPGEGSVRGPVESEPAIADAEQFLRDLETETPSAPGETATDTPAPSAAPGPVPTFQDILAVLPPDTNGDPDLGPLFEALQGRPYGQLAAEEKVALIQQLRGETPAAPKEAAQAAKPAPTTPEGWIEFATTKSQEYADVARRMSMGEMTREEAEAAVAAAKRDWQAIDRARTKGVIEADETRGRPHSGAVETAYNDLRTEFDVASQSRRGFKASPAAPAAAPEAVSAPAAPTIAPTQEAAPAATEAAPRSLTEAIQQAAPQIEAAVQELAGTPSQTEQSAPAANRATVGQAERARFSEILATKEKRSNWAAAAGLSEPQIKALMAEALADGRLRMRKGAPVRTPKARQAAPSPQAEVARAATSVPMGRAAEVRLEKISSDVAYKHAATLLGAGTNTRLRNAALKKLAEDKKATRVVLDEVHLALTGKPSKSMRKKGDVIEALRKAEIAQAAPAPVAAPVVEEESVPLQDIVNPIDRNAPVKDQLRQIAELTAQSKPALDAQLKAMDAQIGTTSNSNIKKPETIVSKASRPSILATKPWHTIAHIRDTLRFQTKITSFDQIDKAAEFMLSQGYRIVKIDTAKMLQPKEWGWRFAGFDLRAPNGQLVEWYIIFDQMYVAKKKGHLLFEKWRNATEAERTEKQDEYEADIASSYRLYTDSFEAGLRNSGYSGLDDARADISRLSASLPEMAAKFSATSSAAGGTYSPLGSQAPSAAGRNLEAPGSGSMTQQRPESRSSSTTGSSISDTSSQFEGGSAIPFDNAADSRIQIAAAPPGDSYAIRTLQSINDPVVKGHYEALARSGTAVEPALGAIASDRRLDAGERQQLAELYVGEPVPDQSPLFGGVRPPADRAAYVDGAAYRSGIASQYVEGEVKKASSREVPFAGELPPLGSWRMDSLKGIHGQEIEHLVKVKIADLSTPETANGLDPMKRGDDARYAQWLRDGLRAPPIEVVQREDGSLRVIDGHRRVLAAKLAGMEEIEAWVNYISPVADGRLDSNGKPIMTGLTFELATMPAIRSAAERRGNDLTSALLHGFSPEISPSNLRVRDFDAQMLETAFQRLADRLPSDALLAVRDALRLDVGDEIAALEGAALSAKAARVEFGIDAGSAKKVIAISLEYGPDTAMRTFTHEEIHLLRGMGIVKGKDWEALAGIAKRRPKKAEATRILDGLIADGKISQESYDTLIGQAGKLTYRELYEVDSRYGDFVKFNEDKLIEETVAHAAADWADGRQFAAPIERVFMRIRDFLEAIQNALNGLGFRSANDIFESIWAGEFVRKFEEANARREEGLQSAREWMGENGVIAMAIGPRPAIGEVWGTKFQTLMSEQYQIAVAGEDLATQYDILSAKYNNALSDPPEMREAMKAEINRLRPIVEAQEAELRADLKRRFSTDDGSTPPMIMAAFAGERATTADLNALNSAKEMDAAGEPREDIWKQTGWFKGVDGRWRFEIDDSSSKLRAFGPDFSLLQVELTHEELFKAYPQMADVEFDRIPGNGGSYTPGGILPSTMEIGKAAKNRRSVTLHESQHGLQDIEGFARGGSPRYVTPDEIRAEQQRIRSTPMVDNGWTEIDNRDPEDEASIRHALYQRLSGEVEARTVEKRLSLTPEQRASRAPWLDYDVPESQQIVRMPDGSGQAMASVEESAPEVMASFRDWLPSRGPTPPQATEQGDSPGLNKIISDLRKTLGMPVSQGLWGMTVQQGNRSARVRPPSNVRGQFDRETGNVSVRQSRDIKTLAHEGGHYLESILGADLGVVKHGYAEALTGDPNAMPAALSEGFARWFESYIIDPQAAEARAPGMTEAFEELLEAERPDMLGAFDTIQNEYQRYITSAPIGEVAAGLSSQYDGTTWRELSADKALDNVSGKLSSAYQGVIDGLNVAAKGVQYLLKTADANGIRDADGRPISIKVNDNFYKKLRLFSGAFSRGRAWLEKGVSDLESGRIMGPSLKAALDRAMGDGRFDMKRYKEFNQYLVSIRALEEYNRLDQKAATVQQYDNTLERLAAARPTVTERVARDQATLDRRQDALTRTNALLSDRRRMLGAAETRLENTQERLQGIQDDISEADEAFRLAGEIADPVASRAVSENYRNMVARRRRSMQIAERDQQQAVRLVERLSEEVSGLGIESTALEAEIAQRREMVAKGRQQIAQLDDTVTRLRRDRERASSAGASRAPTAEPRSVHERVIAEMGTPEFQEAAKLVHDFTFSLLEARRQAGFISQELFDELAKRKDWYVPFWRDMSDIEGAGTMFPGSGVKKWSMFKKFDGSDRSIIMPLEVLSEEAYSTAQQIAFNDVVKTMVGLAERVGPGGGKVAERLARAENMEANDETFGKIKQKAIELGVDPLDAHMITQRMEMNFSDGDIRVILAPENLGPTAKPQLPLWENGERVMVRLPDPAFGRDLFEAINGLGKEMSDILVKALALPAQMLRIGVTSHPDFIFRNIWRDMWTAWKLTGAVPVITQARGFNLIGEGGQVDGMAGEDFRRLYNEAGGVAGGMNLNVEVADSKRDVKALLDTNIDKKAIAAGGALLGFTGVAAGSSIGSMLGLVFGGPVGAGVGFKVGATVGGLVGGLGGGYAARHGEVWKVVESFETATRLGVAAHAYKRAKAHNPDLSDMEAITEAAFVSRDILDWNRRGSKMLAATRLVTFLNAQIQGLDKQLRQMSAQGDRGSVLRKHMDIVFKHQSMDTLSVDEQRDLADAYKSYVRWGAIALMLMGLYALSGDDDDYQDIKDQTKWTHSWFKSLGIWFRLPKPFELAVPSNIGEILWDKYRGYDQRAAERVVDSMYEVLAPPGLPQVMRLAGGVMFNRDRQGIFKGQSREIVGENLASRPPHERYHAFSSEFAIDLSRAMYQAGVPQSLIPAPVKTDFVLSAAGAYWGREVQNSYQTAKTVAGMSTRPDRKATDFPLLRGVTGEAARQSESVSEMYTMISREGGEMTMAATEYKQLMDDRGRPAEAEVWLKSLDKDQQVWALTQYYGSKSDKREHPLERARQADAINREIMRDTITDTLAPKVRQGRKQVRDFDERIELTPAKKTEVIDILARLSQVEARNTMVLLERRGFEGMSIKDPELIMQELKAASKPVYDLLMERRDKKVEDWPSVQREWPRYRERVLKQGVQAF